MTTHQTTSNQTQINLSAKKVLIVDDAQFMRMMIRDVMNFLGVQVVGEAENGKQAIEMFDKFKPDLVTLDLVMPEMPGLEALRKIKEINPKAKIVVVSAMDQREYIIDAIKHGAADFIIKPFEEERIQNAIKKALGASI